jgi:hypothetical protein
MTRPVRVFPEFTVLELKFTARHPNWFNEMVQRFNLMQFSSAKYAEGVVLLGEHRFHDGERSFDWQGLVPIEYAPVPQGVSAPASERKQTAANE